MNTNEITITLDPNARREFIIRTPGLALSHEAVARELFTQFCRHAPPEIVAWIAGQRGGTSGNMFADFATSIRGRQRQELGADLELAQAVRKVMEAKPNA